MSATKSAIPRPNPELLRQLYVDQSLGCPEIGRMFERDSKTVHYWLKVAGIPTRSRGSDARQHFKPGHQARVGSRHSVESRKKIGVATKLQGRVPYLRDGKHWLKGAEPSANPRWLGGATPERQAFYRSVEWKTACAAVWQRADAKCERCAADYRTANRKTERFHVHHIVSFQTVELRAEPLNLVLLCRSCHLWVHSKLNTARDYLQTEEQQQAMPDLFDSIGDAA